MATLPKKPPASPMKGLNFSKYAKGGMVKKGKK